MRIPKKNIYPSIFSLGISAATVPPPDRGSLVFVDGPTGNAAGQKGGSFSEESSRKVLEDACRRCGLDASGAVLMRLGENALYRLSTGPVVVRISRTMDYWEQVRNEVSVAEWLAEAEYPAARIVNMREQPIEVNGHPVTFWRLIAGRDGMPEDITDLARLLRQFHELAKPHWFSLPAARFDSRVERRLETAPVSDADKSFILGKFHELRDEVTRLNFPLAQSPVHGDAHIKNVMISEQSPILVDFEAVGWGQPEWDLSMTATEYATAQWWTDNQYAAFVESYGFDITKWAGFDLMRQVQEIKMTTWLMQNVDQSREIADEFASRLHTIRTGRANERWKPF